jgi:hypothetical protein
MKLYRVILEVRHKQTGERRELAFVVPCDTAGNAARKVPKFYDLSDVELEHTTTMPLPGDEIFLFSSRIL